MGDTNPRNEFIAELDREIKWEWHWEKFNRRFCVAINWTTWITRFLLLSLATFQISIAKDSLSKSWILFSIAAMSMLNVTLPLLSMMLKFQQRQEVHDCDAREYGVIKTELSAGTITLDTAIKQFKKIRRHPTEKIIRQLHD